MSKEELYFSIDVEADGPLPGPNSMLSFGVVCLSKDGDDLGSFERNLMLLDGAKGAPGTMAWWETQPEAWEACRKDLVPPHPAMMDFVDWVDKKVGSVFLPVAVCMPSGFDFLFMYWYMMNFAGRSPFSFSCVDMRTYVMAMRKTGYKKTSKRYWPKRWFPKNMPHTHVAVEDAREQGLTFVAMMKENEL